MAHATYPGNILPLSQSATFPVPSQLCQQTPCSSSQRGYPDLGIPHEKNGKARFDDSENGPLALNKASVSASLARPFLI
jgi:hypothetical protein